MYLEPWRPRRKRSFWPWVLSVAIAVSTGWYLYSKQTALLEAVRGPLPTPTPTEIGPAEHVAVGDSLFFEGHYDDAIGEYRRATEQGPHQSAAYAKWARVLTVRRKTNDSRDAGAASRRFPPSRPSTWLPWAWPSTGTARH